MKKYLEMELEIHSLEVEDVLTGSPNGGLGIDWGETFGDGSQGN